MFDYDDEDDEILLQVGTPRHSGRYPFGSGDDGYQSTSFIGQYEKLKGEGLKEKEIADKMGLNTAQLRKNKTWAVHERNRQLIAAVDKDIAAGLNNVEIGSKYGKSEGTIRNIRNRKTHPNIQFETIEKELVKAVEERKYLDVGIGVEHELGVPRTKWDAVINKMQFEDGYFVHPIFVRRLNDPEKPTTLKVLTKEPDWRVVKQHEAEIRPLSAWSDDRGETLNDLKPPVPMAPEKVKIRYSEEGGIGKDGVIELRPGVEDLEMGGAHYAQVRIQVGDDRYLKGMAVYGETKDFPDGIDMIFNTNKKVGTPFRDVLKETKEGVDPIEKFGSSIASQNKSKVLNIVYKEGDWTTWSTDISSQFLSKQPLTLIKNRLDATKKDIFDDFDELNSLTNPVVKDFLLSKYSDGLVSKAKQLDAKGLPHTKSHVILPFPNMNPDEIYAPNYENGSRVVLIRHPHGGIFEIPEVTVNNKNEEARKLMGTSAPDAIGIHPTVAQKLSGADFDGDTVMVIPNNTKGPLAIKTSRSLKELKNFDPHDYKVDYQTIDKDHMQTEMGIASNLITDMTIKGASQSEIARAVKHSMVVIDSFKHKLDYIKSKQDNGIAALRKNYQSHINPDTGKKTTGGSTLISRSKKKIDISDPDFDPQKYSSGTQREQLYVDYVKELMGIKNTADKTRASIIPPKYNKEAAKTYKPEIDELNKKLIIAKMNAPP